MLAIELDQFNTEERGGLLTEDQGQDGYNILEHLTLSDIDFQHYNEAVNHEHHRSVDDKCLLVMKQLRQMGHLEKEDIQIDCLLHRICIQKNTLFAEKRLRFLVEWDPTALSQYNDDYNIPLHHAASFSCIEGFQIVFEYGIRYYPKKNGIHLLFQKNARMTTHSTKWLVKHVDEMK
jgi:hypothetical protein